MTHDETLNRTLADIRLGADREAACKALRNALVRGDTKDVGRWRKEAYRLTHAILRGDHD